MTKCKIHGCELEEVWIDSHRPDYICNKCLEESDKRISNETGTSHKGN